MTEKNILTPKKSANMLNRIIDVFHQAHGGKRFPIDIDQIAFESANIFKWKDPVSEIKAVNHIPNFEGMLCSNETQSKWLIAYNNSLASEGRIRFTKAHELGHYILHRNLQEEFFCTRDDMLEWSQADNIESQADIFASFLLMPLDDFRLQIKGKVSLDMFSHCADRYGVSLTASILKWLSATSQKALLILSNDGYMNWAVSSQSALKSGAFFKTKLNTIEIPKGSLTSNNHIATELNGSRIASKLWFTNADPQENLLEMKQYSHQYGCTLTLLILPRDGQYWPPYREVL